MRLLLLTPELSPFVRVGGIGEGLSALSRALVALGHEVTAALPRHEPSEPPDLALTRLPPIALPDAEIGVLEAASGGARVLLLEVAEGEGARAGSLGVYGDDVSDRADDARRFARFARAAVAIAEDFDVLHAHEWPAAAAAYLLRARPGDAGRPRAVVTLHNLAHQGIFPAAALADLGLGPEHLRPDRLEFYGRLNLLKAGLVAADAITTVSPTYAREIQEPERGELLHGVLRARAADLRGITNGIDDVVWDPAADPALPARYSAADPAPKAICKRAFLREIGLDPEGGRPLVASLGRVIEQKGSDLLAEALPAIVAAGADVVIAGGGEPALERALAAAAGAAPGRAAFLGPVSDAVAHRLLAAADLVVMPSRYEPCGLVQLEAQRYGALPVARRTGGLCDTITDADRSPEAGTGFLFDEPAPGALAAAVARALAALRGPRGDELRRRVMRLELGWRGPALRYERLYHEILARAARGSGRP